MRIAVAGVGAISGLRGVKLAAADDPVSVPARGATLAALQSGSCGLTSAATDVEAIVTASDPIARDTHD